jgi:hypothetical protein
MKFDMIKRMHETDPHALQMFTNFVFFVEFLFQKVVVKNILISLSLLVYCQVLFSSGVCAFTQDM